MNHLMTLLECLFIDSYVMDKNIDDDSIKLYFHHHKFRDEPLTIKHPNWNVLSVIRVMFSLRSSSLLIKFYFFPNLFHARVALKIKFSGLLRFSLFPRLSFHPTSDLFAAVETLFTRLFALSFSFNHLENLFNTWSFIIFIKSISASVLMTLNENL